MSVAFDTLKFARALQGKAKMSAEQAEGVAEAFAEATGEQLATKTDLRIEIASLRSDINTRFARVDGELTLLKWMLGFVLAMVVAILFLLLRH